MSLAFTLKKLRGSPVSLAQFNGILKCSHGEGYYDQVFSVLAQSSKMTQLAAWVQHVAARARDEWSTSIKLA